MNLIALSHSNTKDFALKFQFNSEMLLVLEHVISFSVFISLPTQPNFQVSREKAVLLLTPLK